MKIAADELEQLTRAYGQELFARLDRQGPLLFTPGWFDERLLEWTMQEEAIKVQLFRFIDVLPLLHDPVEVTRHLREYFAEAGESLPGWVRLGLHGLPRDGLGTRLLARLARANARRLADAGLAGSETELAMAAPLSKIRADEPAPRGLDIRRVATLRGLADFASVEAANWWPPDENVLRFYERAAPLLLALDSPIRLYVGYVGNEAVAASELTVGGGVAGLYGIATLEAHRRRGYGTAMTLRPLLEARAEGLEIAVLQASAAGAGVYRRVGFEEFGGITEYKPS